MQSQSPPRMGSADTRANFVAPDSGPDKTEYACSFHWFRAPDGKLVGVDVVRSDDMDRRTLRVFTVDAAGEIKSLIVEKPSEEWAPFVTDSPPALDPARSVLARGENWIAGAASASSQPISRAAFQFNLKPLSKGRGTGDFGLRLFHLAAMDFTEIEMSGWFELDGVRTAISSTVGRASIHFGDFLPDYAGVNSAPGRSDATSAILVNVTDADDAKRPVAAVLRKRSFVYGFGTGGVPGFFTTVGQLEKGHIPLGEGGHLELTNVKPFEHTFLGRPTITALAQATYVKDPLVGKDRTLSLGPVVLDFRGENYARFLRL